MTRSAEHRLFDLMKTLGHAPQDHAPNLYRYSYTIVRKANYPSLCQQYSTPSTPTLNTPEAKPKGL